MSEEYDYITLYLPVDESSIESLRNYKVLKQECLDWLNINVGHGTFCIREWLLAHDTDQYDWCYLGVSNLPESGDQVKTFLLKDLQKAVLFKLRWG